MSFEAFVWAWRQPVENATDQHILLAVANVAPIRETYASVTYLANITHRSERQVRRCLAKLEDCGLISMTARPGRTDLIRINIPDDFTVSMPPEGDLEAGKRGRPRKAITPDIGAENPGHFGIKPPPQGSDELRDEPSGTEVVIRARDPFDAWWDTYPRHVAKEAARKAWMKVPAALAADKLDLARLMERTSAYADHVVGKDPEHVAHPATWLNGKRWNDELPARSQTDGRTTNRPDRAADQHTARVEAMLSGGVEAINRRRRWTLGG